VGFGCKGQEVLLSLDLETQQRVLTGFAPPANAKSNSSVFMGFAKSIAGGANVTGLPALVESSGGSSNRFEPYGQTSTPSPSWKGIGKGVRAAVAYTAVQLIEDLKIADALPKGDHLNGDVAVIVDGLPHDCSPLELYMIFTTFGPIQLNGITTVPARDGTVTGQIRYQHKDHAVYAVMTLNDLTMPDGAKLRVYHQR